MELAEQALPLVEDPLVRRPIYPHQQLLLRNGTLKKAKLHAPTAAGKTLAALLFALSPKFKRPDTATRAIFTYPTNLLSRDQFQRSVVRGLVEWVGADAPAVGILDPVKAAFVPDRSTFERAVTKGAPTYVFRLPAALGQRDLYVSVITGEGLQYLLSAENILELGRRKGTYLLSILKVLNQRDHIILCSPDLLGYVAQRRYSVSANFYNPRWRDELEIKLSDHDVIVDEYHFYDPYTYLNLSGTLERLGVARLLCLSATGTPRYFPDAQTITPTGSEISPTRNLASQPIEVAFHGSEMPQPHAEPRDQEIWFYHSAIEAHETANALRGKEQPVTEWTGIQKTQDPASMLTIATSAAEIGLDLRFRTCHTEFWGNAWEIPSLIQRIGRVGRSQDVGRSTAHVWISGREPGLLPSLFNGTEVISKTEFSARLSAAFGEEPFRPEDYVSYYLWSKDKMRELRRYWQMPPDSPIRFHFRPPNSQAVFNWGGTKFVYDWTPIANRYQLEKIAEVTAVPFWHEMGYAEYKVAAPLERRTYYQRYQGRKDKDHRRWFMNAQ